MISFLFKYFLQLSRQLNNCNNLILTCLVLASKLLRASKSSSEAVKMQAKTVLLFIAFVVKYNSRSSISTETNNAASVCYCSYFSAADVLITYTVKKERPLYTLLTCSYNYLRCKQNKQVQSTNLGLPVFHQQHKQEWKNCCNYHYI